MRKQTKRRLALPAETFKRKLGVTPSTYEQRKAALETREADKKRSGRPPALCLDDQPVLTLSLWREYRTQVHLAEAWEVDQNIRRTIERVEHALIGSSQVSLPGRTEAVIVDVAESPVERPKQSDATTSARKSGTTTAGLCRASQRSLSTAYGQGQDHDFKRLTRSGCAESRASATELPADSGCQGVANLRRAVRPSNAGGARPSQMSKATPTDSSLKSASAPNPLFVRLKGFVFSRTPTVIVRGALGLGLTSSLLFTTTLWLKPDFRRRSNLDTSEFDELTPEEILMKLYILGVDDFIEANNPEVPVKGLLEGNLDLN